MSGKRKLPQNMSKHKVSVGEDGLVQPKLSTVLQVVDEESSSISTTSNYANITIDKNGLGHSNSRILQEETTQDNILYKDEQVSIEDLLKEIMLHHQTEEEPEIQNFDSYWNKDNELLNDDEDEDGWWGLDEPEKQTTEPDTAAAENTIYPGHTMTVATSMLLIMVFAVSHSVTGAMLNDMLTLISLHCLQTPSVYRSLARFKKYFSDLKSPLIKHHFCKSCQAPVTLEDVICPNSFCKKDLSTKCAKSYHIEIPIMDQLKTLYGRQSFLTLLSGRFNRKNKNGMLSDIIDGSVHSNLSNDGGPLSESHPWNISFTWNSDGIPVFKSSKFALWPMYLMINELPPKERKKKENMIFAGLWFGDSKPLITTFGDPLYQSLKHLEQVGMDVKINGNVENVKGFLICGTADLPARCCVQNHVQFNGFYSCMTCDKDGSSEKTAKGGNVHVYLCSDTESASDLLGKTRTHKELIANAKGATSSNKPVMGVKGPSFLMGLRHYDMVKSAGIDYMHCVLLGVSKLLMTLWFATSNSSQSFSISQTVELVDDRLTNISPPSFITRRPRSISSHSKFWKASELRAWLFFYSLPCLTNILPMYLLYHYACLVEAIFLLCGENISPSDVNHAENLLRYFVFMFQTYYGKRYCGLNMHQLLHLTDCVRNLGPLWAYSCFPFEDMNGQLLKLFHGTQAVELQIVSAVSVVQNLPHMLTSLPENSVEKQYANRLQSRKQTKLLRKIDHNVSLVGRGYLKHVPDDLYACLLKVLHYVPCRLQCYNRIVLRGQTIHSKDYTRSMKRDNCTIKYVSDKKLQYGVVQYFLEVCPCRTYTCYCSNSSVFAVVYGFECQPYHRFDENFLGVNLRHVHFAKKRLSTVQLVSVNNILKLVVHVDIGDCDVTYFSESPNVVETD